MKEPGAHPFHRSRGQALAGLGVLIVSNSELRVERAWVRGACCPGGQNPEVANRTAKSRKTAASEQAQRIRAVFIYHPGADLEQSPTDGGELGPGEIHPARLGIAAREHQPVGGGVEREAELVSERAGGVVGGELGLVQLDQIFPLSPFTTPPRRG